MSDLIGGGTSASAGAGRSGNGRTQAAPATTGSPNIRGPRDIMRDRAARERRRAEEAAQLAALERARAEEEARLIDEERRRSAERRAAAAGAAGQQRDSGDGGGGQRGSGGTIGQQTLDGSQRRDRTSGDRVVSGERNQDHLLQGVGRGGRAVGGGDQAAPTRQRPTQQEQQPRPVQPEVSRTRPAQAQPAPSAVNPPINQAQGETNVAAPTRSSFPHAFERWETLSAHWEGLTSFWIRRLEENSNEINRDPLSQQLSRQVTDLSAAGANLFHAVVELQRLRASSERKFQRWFFETRADQERSQEIQAMTEATLEDERRARAAAIAEAVAQERERSNSDKLLAEMKRELQISKDEARRAWEELGRREQEERERTASLREGQPTLVGGVQVVPMMQGVPSRHGSARAPEAPYTTGATSGGHPDKELEGPVDDSDAAYQRYARAQRADPVDPFVEMQQSSGSPRVVQVPPVSSTSTQPLYAPVYSQAPAVQPASTSGFYQQQQGTSLHPIDPTGRAEHDPSYGPSVQSEGAFSEEEYEIDAQGQFIRDDRGNKVRYQGPVSDDDTDEYDVTVARQRELAHLQEYGRPRISGVEYGRGSTTTAGYLAPPAIHPISSDPDDVDYSGEGYGSGWGAVPLHSHPTRLSDVLEEDEHSRTSASQVGRRE